MSTAAAHTDESPFSRATAPVRWQGHGILAAVCEGAALRAPQADLALWAGAGVCFQELQDKSGLRGTRLNRAAAATRNRLAYFLKLPLRQKRHRFELMDCFANKSAACGPEHLLIGERAYGEPVPRRSLAGALQPPEEEDFYRIVQLRGARLTAGDAELEVRSIPGPIGRQGSPSRRCEFISRDPLHGGDPLSALAALVQAIETHANRTRELLREAMV